MSVSYTCIKYTLHYTQQMTERDLKSKIQLTSILRNTTHQPSTYTRTSSHASTTTTLITGLDKTAIVFIVLGVVAAFMVLCILIYFVHRRRKRGKSTTKSTSTSSEPHSIGAHGPASLRSPPSRACIKPLCREYLNQLNLNKAYFATPYDKCWCSSCHDPSNSSSACGNHCRQQHGWVRFGLHINRAHQKQWHIFREWKTSYYGTSSNRLASIISNRFSPFDDDKLDDGTIFNSGHSDRTCCTTSPSLTHASQRKFTTRSQFFAHDGTNYHVFVVLQCKQKPDTYRIDRDSASFHDIEWKTQTRGCVLPYGLMISLKKRI